MSENNVNSTEEIVLSVEMGDAVSAQTAEAYAVGKRGGVDVAETDPTWHNNAKYYAEQAEEAAGEAQGAEEAAQRAEAAQTAAEAAQAQAAGSAATAGQQAAAAAGSAQDAVTAKTGAETAQSAAAGSATAAEGSAGRASQSATAAAGSATAAGTAKTAAETARDAAAGSATAAAGSASAADQSAQAAAASAQAAEDVAESIPEDYSQLSADVTGLKSAFEQLNDNVITESAGPAPIVSIADGADGMPMRSVEVAIEPVQDLHGYDSPWPGGGNKNKFSGAWPPDVSGSYAGWNTGATTLCCIKLFDKGNGADISGIYFGIGENGTNTPVVWAITNGTASTDPIRMGAGYGTALYPYVVLYPATEEALNKVLNRFNVMVSIDGEDVTTYSSYSNICPISGWTGAKVTRTGKNLLNISQANEVRKNGATRFTLDYLGDNTVRMNASSVGALYVVWEIIKVAPHMVGKSITVSNDENNNIYIYKTGKDGSWASSPAGFPSNVRTVTFTEDDVGRAFGYGFYNDSGTAKTITHLQAEFGSTSSAFEPYQADTYEVTFPTEAGTVYGGTLDVVSGKLVVDRAMMDLGTLTWTMSSRDGITFFYAPISDKENSRYNIGLCSAYPVIRQNVTSAASAVDLLVDKSVGMSFNTTASRVYVRDDSYASAIALRTALSGVMLCYELAAPQSYTLSPQEIRTLLGINNVWSDAGNTAITYPADTKMYIDNRINSTRRLIAGIEIGFVASKAYSAGDMLIIGDDLYKVASAIASGATITVGTNVNKTTVAEQLLALANA